MNELSDAAALAQCRSTSQTINRQSTERDRKEKKKKKRNQTVNIKFVSPRLWNSLKTYMNAS